MHNLVYYSLTHGFSSFKGEERTTNVLRETTEVQVEENNARMDDAEEDDEGEI